MPLVIDASVAFKWFVPEAGRAEALALLDGDEPLWAPDLVLLEVGNGMFGRLRNTAQGREASVAAVERLGQIYSRLWPSRDYAIQAVSISFELRHPIYDCIYLALCMTENVRLVTADDRLVTNARGTRFEQWVTEL